MIARTTKSPFTGGKAEEVYELTNMEFSGEQYLVHTRCYKCCDTGETFTDSEQDGSTLNDLYAQYRIKHGIPFPDEIKEIRCRYNLNYTQIGKMLGFGEFSHKKIEGMVLFLSEGGIFPTKLNKKMFYSDFLHFKRHGISISGLRYQAIHFGPVPVHYCTIYDHIPGLTRKTEFISNCETSTLTPTQKPDLSVFNEKELQTLVEINDRLTPLSTQEIIELSHKEAGWINHYPAKGIIPFSDAYMLSI